MFSSCRMYRKLLMGKDTTRGLRRKNCLHIFFLVASVHEQSNGKHSYTFVVLLIKMAKAGGCLFRIGYYFYSRTRVGYYYHQKDIKKAKEKLGDNGHSELTEFEYGNLTVLPIPMLLDNFAYLVTDKKNKKNILIDPGHAEPVQNVLNNRNIQPDAILVTHKHWDHSGGNEELKRQFPGIPVYGGGEDNVPGATRTLNEKDKVDFGDLHFQVMLTPGHTVGHIVYLLDGTPFGVANSLFSGDHLFLGGCGRMFEAAPATMLTSLDKLMDLSDDTLLWPGHEYAKDNLGFACHIDSENVNAQRKLEWVEGRRESSLCTCPSSIGEEKTYNPFLRTSEEAILRRLGMIDCGDFSAPSNEIRARALSLIRDEKDHYKYRL